MLLICYEACKWAQHTKELPSKWSHWDAKQTSANNAVKKLGKQKWLRENWVNSSVNISLGNFIFIENQLRKIDCWETWLSECRCKCIQELVLCFLVCWKSWRAFELSENPLALTSKRNFHAQRIQKFLNFCEAKPKVHFFSAIDFVGRTLSSGNLKIIEKLSEKYHLSFMLTFFCSQSIFRWMASVFIHENWALKFSWYGTSCLNRVAKLQISVKP